MLARRAIADALALTLPLLVAILVGVAGLGLGVAPAAAQGYGWFGNLFGGGQPQRTQQPNFPGGYGQGQGDGGAIYVPRKNRRHSDRQAQQKRPPPRDTAVDHPPPKKNATAFVYIFGDTFGQFLANGLDEALADRPDVGVVRKTHGSSSLVNTSYFDWPKTVAAELASKDKIDVAVMMIGANDRQPITEDGKTFEIGSDEWIATYKKRVMAIDEAFHKKNIPLIWVGVPIAKSTDFADTMAMINDITRDAAEQTGATYVDTWDAFSDEDGHFAAYGPDIDGQTVKLRSADGILFTHAGARKLAHFVEAHVRRILDGKAPTPALPTAAAPAPGTAKTDKAPAGSAKQHVAHASKPAKPEAGPITNLNQVPSAANGELATPTTYRADGALLKGDTDAPPPGRADDAHWSAEAQKSP